MQTNHANFLALPYPCIAFSNSSPKWLPRCAHKVVSCWHPFWLLLRRSLLYVSNTYVDMYICSSVHLRASSCMRTRLYHPPLCMKSWGIGEWKGCVWIRNAQKSKNNQFILYIDFEPSHIIIVRTLFPTMWGQLHEFCFSIPAYVGPNLQIG